MILSILVTLAFVATLLFMLVRAFTGPIRHRHSRPVHHEALLFFATNGVAMLIGGAGNEKSTHASV